MKEKKGKIIRFNQEQEQAVFKLCDMALRGVGLEANSLVNLVAIAMSKPLKIKEKKDEDNKMEAPKGDN